MQKKMGLESLIQSGRSALFNALVSLYQESFDGLQEAYTASDHDIWMSLRNIDFGERFKRIVKEHMNVDIRKVSVVSASVPQVYCITQATNRPKRSPTTLTPGTVFAAIDRYYNDKTAKLEKNETVTANAAFSIIIGSAFWRIRNKDQTFYYTAEELAAMSIHELGHVDEAIRNNFRVMISMIDAADIVDYVTTNHDRKAILDLLDHLLKSPYLDRELISVVLMAKKFFTEANDINDALYFEVLSTISLLVSSEVAGRNLVALDRLLEERHTRVKTKNQLLDVERSADEFTARNGAYAAFVSLQQKDSALETANADLIFTPNSWIGAQFAIRTLFSFVSLFYLPSEDVRNGYDPLLRRLNLIVETAKHAFSNEDLTPDVREDIKAQIAEAEEYIRIYQSSAHFKTRQLFKAWKDNIKKFGRIVASPFQDRLSQDYGRLQDANRFLTRHPLYYLANK